MIKIGKKANQMEYNKKGEVKFFLVVDFICFLAFVLLMIYTQEINLIYIIISIGFLLKTIYNYIKLKKI